MCTTYWILALSMEILVNHELKHLNFVFFPISFFLQFPEPLSAPSQASVTFLSEDSVSLVIQLPSSGTPPVLEVSFNFTSTSHSFTHYVRGQFMLEEELTVDIGGNEVSLHSGSRYTVTVRARNFVGWSNFSSGTKFTTCELHTIV